MAELNICSGLEIPQIDIENPFAEMFMMQYRLQHRLGKRPGDKDYIANIIYWQFCIASEIKELTDWFNIETNNLWKEVQMEAIDCLHFVMNIGLELNYSKEFHTSITSLCSFTPSKTIDNCTQCRGNPACRFDTRL